MSNGKGTFIPGLAFFFIIGLLVIVSAILFFIFFKVHVTSIAVDVESINRYQEIPTIVLTSSVFAAGNCHTGNGPAGEHDINYDLCTKRLAFFFNKEEPMLSKDTTSFDLVEGVNDILDFRQGLALSLPENDCYSVSFEHDGKESDTMMRLTGETTRGEERASGNDCNINDEGSLKLRETYPIPIFMGGEPAVANNVIKIARSLSTGEELLVTWPMFRTEFRFDPNQGGV